MKRIIVKSSNPKILQGQSQKLKEKLEHLKKQIEAKKKEKQINKNVNTAQSKLTKSRKSNSIHQQVTPQLNALLTHLKLEQIVTKLKDRGIITCQQFHHLTVQELDKWKDIAVGYRIKLKKYIQKVSQNEQQTKKQSLDGSPESKIQQRNIEDIVNCRKQEQIYVPLNREYEENELQEQQQLKEEQQEVMILSLIQAFKGVPNNVNHTEEYSNQFEEQNVETVNKLKIKQEVTSKEQSTSVQHEQKMKVEMEKQFYPDYKYCWQCLKMLKNTTNCSFNNRQFCSQLCLQKYKTSSHAQQTSPFYVQISQVQQQFSTYLKARVTQSKLPSKQIKKKQIQLEDELDLEIV